MSSQPSHKYTLEEYLALELASEEKYEFWNGEVFCMSGASLAHNQIARNIGTKLDTELRGRGCQVFPADLRVKVPQYPPYRYPDLTALCGPPEIENVNGLDMLVNPTLIVEVLSKSTEGFDRGDKFTYYKSIASFSEYLLVAQHRPHVSQFVRQESGVWTFMEFNDLTDTVRCASVPCALTLQEIYRDVTFDEAARNGNRSLQTNGSDEPSQ
ncbi:MAG TPA: Uma2 family endonuclease [Pyrinomonadaceae bacterium]|nr:Uma2 family endonuclease [Pyrinomonadaceae bacterium]